MLYAVIMAGGSGTRFWPASRVAMPKQMLNLVGEHTMIQDTVRRLGDLVPNDRLLVVTNKQLVEGIRDQLRGVPSEAVIGEPCKRDTAPCIGLAAAMVAKGDEDAIMVVMPADHVIKPDELFRETIQTAVDLVVERPSRIVTFGIGPNYAADIYGYIQRGEAIQHAGKQAAFRVEKFREKPSSDVARQYLESGDYYWNSGIFVWKASTILNALEQFEPEMHEHIMTIADALGTPSQEEVLEREFSAINGKSIDYAVMENYEDILVLEATYQWDDLGNWNAMQRMRGTDDDGNTLIGKHLGLDTKGSIVRSEGDHLIVTIGLDDMIVVHTPRATLVAPKKEEEKLRDVVAQLKKRGWDQYL